MKRRSEPEQTREQLRQSIIGLGEKSIRKSYYPELQQRIHELEQANTELQAEIKEKLEAQQTARRLTEQLQQSQKMEAIGTLAGGVAHDFNNILSVIIGHTELAQLHINGSCGSTNCPSSRDLDMVLKAAGRAKELVSQILTFSRKQNYERKPISLAIVVADALKLLRSSLPQSVTIQSKIEARNALILGNDTQIHQIMMNLCTNAKHAMGEKGGTLAVELLHVEIDQYDHKSNSLQLAPGPYLLLKICDDGCGIERSSISKIFDPYYTTKAKDHGTGMGLAVVHGIVKSHDGHITVYSEPGKGTSFQIYLPELVDLEKTPTVESIDEVLMGTETILVVDDEPVVAALHQRILESLGYKVVTETVPRRALEAFSKTPHGIDLVMTDMTMPDLNGAALTQGLLQVRPDLPVILCTGFSELINEKKAKAIGIRAFAMKPLVRKAISRIVRQALDS